jgi:hypothetical protein
MFEIRTWEGVEDATGRSAAGIPYFKLSDFQIIRVGTEAGPMRSAQGISRRKLQIPSVQAPAFGRCLRRGKPEKLQASSSNHQRGVGEPVSGCARVVAGSVSPWKWLRCKARAASCRNIPPRKFFQTNPTMNAIRSKEDYQIFRLSGYQIGEVAAGTLMVELQVAVVARSGRLSTRKYA